MSLTERLRLALGGEPRITVRALVKGRIGAAWFDDDVQLRLPEGATLAEALEALERAGVPVRQVLDDSPHLRHTMQLNGERCPVDEQGDRVLVDGDELYLLAPFAGG